MPLGAKPQPHCGDRTPGALVLKPTTEPMKKGYSLHISRLGYIGDTAVMRTFKFPLVKALPPKKKKDFSNVPQELVEAIIHDDLYLRGPSNPVDYVRYIVKKEKTIYTLVDFWLDSLLIGVVFQPSTAKLIDFVTTFRDGKSIYSRVFEAADERIKRFFDTTKFIDEVITKGEIRANRTRTSFVNAWQKLLRKDLTDDEKAQAEEIINKIADDLFEGERLKSSYIGQEAQNKYWLESWGLDKASVGVDFDLSAFVIPEIALDFQTLVVDETNVIEIFEDIYSVREKLLLERFAPIQSLSEDEKDKKTKDLISSLLGLSDNFNALSNYFSDFLKLLQKGEIETILERFKKISPNEEWGRIKDSLGWLADKVKYLEDPQLPGVTGWHDYRSLLGGRLQSWYSNHIKRKDEQKEQIEKLLTSFGNIQKFINFEDHTPPEDIDEQVLEQRREGILNTIERIKQLVETEDVYNDKKAYAALVELVNDLRYQLNLFYQAYYKEEAKESPGDHPLLKDFWNLRIYKPRSFYGYAQREKVAKLVKNTIPTIKSGITIVNTLIPKLLETVDWQKVTEEKERNTIREDAGIRRLLRLILNKYKDKAVNTSEFREFYRDILLQHIADTVSIKGPDGSVETKPINKTDVFEKDKYLVYKSAYSTSPLKEVDLAVTDYVDATKEIIMKLIDQLNRYDTQSLLNNPKLLLDWVETAKIVVARLIRWNKNEEFDLEEYSLIPQNLRFFERAHLYLEKLNISKMPHNEFAKFVNSYIMSDFKGSATVFSKRRIRVRYIVQPVGSEEKYPLFVEKKNGEIVDVDELQTNRKEILKDILFKIGIPSKDVSNHRITMFKKKEWKNTLKRVDGLVINTSYYQLQWVERLIYKPQHWQDFEITTAEPSLIVEQRYRIKWNLEEELPEFRLEKDKKPVLYYTLPFKIAPQTEKEQRVKIFRASLKNEPQNYHFLGADIGEYGIAWIIIKVDEDKKQIIVKDYGFIYDPRIKRIQEHFKEIQQKARLGEFLEESTVVAYLRENAIGYLRNRLHDKLTKYKGHIIYESNISAFEAGSGRVTKIYDSVKRPDVGNHPDATRDVYAQLIKHIWGIERGGKKYAPGWQVGASGTSYTCISCGRNVYDINTSGSLWKIKDREGNIVTFSNGIVEILGYTEASLDPNKEYKTKDIFKYIKSFARPPLATWVEDDKENGENNKENTNNPKPKSKGRWEIRSETIKKFVIDRGVLSKEQVIKMRQHRGNSALFVCPYADCLAVADADIQAAFNIALRGYIYATEFAKGNDPKADNPKFKEIFSKRLEAMKHFKKTGKLGWLFSQGCKDEN